ncbi:MAG: bacteriocin [Caldithrix sp.]|nr:bacteriocin [Caldithrix sp.]
MDILKKGLAPITDQAWQVIEEESREMLTMHLTARRFVDLDGPNGIAFSAVSLGQLALPKNQKKDEVQYGIHTVLPLMEVRMPFDLNIWELDNLHRGKENIDLTNMEKAAKKIAQFEEQAIYYGFEGGSIQGLYEKSEHKSRPMPKNAEQTLKSLPEGIQTLKDNAVDGPYHLIVNPNKWQEISSYVKGYPLKKQVENMLEGRVVTCPNISGMFLVPLRGGHFKLTIGMDLSIGYESHNAKEVKLYFTESFTFQVLDPAAYIIFE